MHATSNSYRKYGWCGLKRTDDFKCLFARFVRLERIRLPRRLIFFKMRWLSRRPLINMMPKPVERALVLCALRIKTFLDDRGQEIKNTNPVAQFSPATKLNLGYWTNLAELLERSKQHRNAVKVIACAIFNKEKKRPSSTTFQKTIFLFHGLKCLKICYSV